MLLALLIGLAILCFFGVGVNVNTTHATFYDKCWKDSSSQAVHRQSCHSSIHKQQTTMYGSIKNHVLRRPAVVVKGVGGDDGGAAVVEI